MTVGHLVAFYLRLEIGHVLAAGHQVGDLFTALLALAKIGRLGAPDEDREVVADRQRMDDAMRNEDHGETFLASLQDNADDVSGLLDAKRRSRLIEDQHPCPEVYGARDRK